ncbi:hypothetical protein L1987_46718 [Smallanthus sonchifolius]|uniref:Uncharacterized protein n=1 Tax=Smallanthus sonchifolius TaxID=185202 RepID=A0ACB9G0D1_9ASTR|nr:hypothetical protein L1987_46718 [Smallanthus sonchifolius]
MDVMISVTEANGLVADYDADTIIKATCMTLIAGSADTTSVMLTWALSLLLNNRDTLRKAQEELDTHVGKGASQVASGLDSVVTKWLEEHRKKRAYGDTTTETDFMDVMISVTEANGLVADYDADTIIKATCMVRTLNYKDGYISLACSPDFV